MDHGIILAEVVRFWLLAAALLALSFQLSVFDKPSLLFGRVDRPIPSVDFYKKIKFCWASCDESFWPFWRIADDFCYFDTAESIDWRGSRAADFAKSCCQRT
jgi:hypothetical protein